MEKKIKKWMKNERLYGFFFGDPKTIPSEVSVIYGYT
jgi:hypothetical protein